MTGSLPKGEAGLSLAPATASPDSARSMQKVYYRDWGACRQVPFAFIFSRLAAPLSWILSAAHATPNYITLLVATSGFLAILGALLGAWVPAGGALLVFLALDHVDGQVARATNQRTSLGGYLDTLVDLVVDVLFLAAIAAWGILHEPRTALLAVMALVGYVVLELVNRHGGHTLILEALRAGDFRARNEPPTIRGPLAIVPHRDLNIVILAAGLIAGHVALALAALAAWWSAWALWRVSKDVHRPKNTEGVLLDLMHEDNH